MIHQLRNSYSYRQPESKGYRSKDVGDLTTIPLPSGSSFFVEPWIDIQHRYMLC